MLRPKAYDKQKNFSDGKQKKNSFKNQLIVMPSGQEIVDVVVGNSGLTSDINIWRDR
jgi:DDE superfamily endonuclease